MPAFSTRSLSSRFACTGTILAGGRSSRFGGLAKGLERVGGRRIIDRVAESLASCTDRLIIISNDPAAAEWIPGVATFPDVIAGSAGLSGIHAALARSGSNVLVVAWDMPFVPGELLAELRARGAEADAVLPASGSRRGLEPLCAYYSQACLLPIENALTRGEKMPIAFHDDVKLTVLSHAEVSRFGSPEVIFMNVNTPEDLALAEAIVRDSQ